MKKYNAAIFAFKSKYNEYPGDTTKAYDFFGNTCTTGVSTTQPPSYHGGNGNGYIDTGTIYEHTTFFCQLGRAGLIADNFIGQMATTIDRQFPKSRYASDAYFGVKSNYNRCGYHPAYNGIPLANDSCFSVSTDKNFTGDERWGTVLPLDAQWIDLKIDDGIYNRGNITVYNSVVYGAYVGPPSGQECIVSSTYNINSTYKECVLSLRIKQW